MERERPDYLPKPKSSRWEFPWLAVIAISLAGLSIAGVRLMGKTNAAWSERFLTPAEQASIVTTPNDVHPVDGSEELQRQAMLSELRSRRITPEANAVTAGSTIEIKCIDGTVFRRIEGGWENMPGAKCTSGH